MHLCVTMVNKTKPKSWNFRWGKSVCISLVAFFDCSKSLPKSFVFLKAEREHNFLCITITFYFKYTAISISIIPYPSTSKLSPMASQGTIQRPSTTSSTSIPTDQQSYEPKSSALKRVNEFKFIFPFNFPTTPESAAVRIVQNLGSYGDYYTLFIWISLFITLIPERKVSLIYLVATTVVACVYLVLHRDCVVLQRIVDKRLVLALLVVVAMVELILTEAALHLFVTLGCGVPLVLVHAVLLRVRDDEIFVEKESNYSADGELAPLRKTSEEDHQFVDSVWFYYMLKSKLLKILILNCGSIRYQISGFKFSIFFLFLIMQC